MIQESIIDASEDSQLEAAIAASLKETSAEESANDAREYIDTPDDDSLTEFTDSESESERTRKDTLGNEAIKNETRSNTEKWVKNDNKQKEESVVDGVCVKENETESRHVKRQDCSVETENTDTDDDDPIDPGALRPTAFFIVRSSFMIWAY